MISGNSVNHHDDNLDHENKDNLPFSNSADVVHCTLDIILVPAPSLSSN